MMSASNKSSTPIPIPDKKLGKILIENEMTDHKSLGQWLEAIKQSDEEGLSLAQYLSENKLVDVEKMRQLIQAHSRFKQIGGFHIIETIGRGGMGKVYRAKQLSMNREVAIKILSRELSQDKRGIRRFYREARAAAKLNHPNIVRAIEVGKDRGRYYFAMALVKGKTIFDMIEDSQGHLSEAYSLHIIRQVVLGLEHASKNHLIHRDIKPENIVVTADRTPDTEDTAELGQLDDIAKIVDLGIVKLENSKDISLTRSEITLGTPHYISPEQAEGDEDLDFRTDIYSLGASFYHMLCGQPPFTGNNVAQVLYNQINQALRPPEELNPEISKSCSLILQRMLKKDKEERYPSFEELLYDINALIAGKPIQYAIQPGKYSKPIKWLMVAALSIIITIIVLVAYGGLGSVVK